VRADTFGYVQRCWPDSSIVDRIEARRSGRFAAQLALQGHRDGSVAIERTGSGSAAWLGDAGEAYASEYVRRGTVGHRGQDQAHARGVPARAQQREPPASWSTACRWWASCRASSGVTSPWASPHPRCGFGSPLATSWAPLGPLVRVPRGLGGSDGCGGGSRSRGRLLRMMLVFTQYAE
jgi:hypothetical protein